jgi:uncharacterized membrane protein YphA (DoxX/SURF4 family)
MIRNIAGVFLFLHGFVHLLYFGQSQRIFELQPGMPWPDGSWAFGKLIGAEPTRAVASLALLISALGLIAGGLAILLGQPWWQAATVGSLALSSLLYLAMWNATFEHLDNQGLIGILINLAILAAVLIFRWPKFAF